MREVRLQKLHIPRTLQRLLPVVPLALGLVAVAVADQGGAPESTVATTSPSPLQSPQATPGTKTTTSVNVNGQQVPIGKDGSASVDLPGGGRLDVSGDDTTVSTSDGSANSNSGGNRNVNVNVNSNNADNSGNSWSSTQVDGNSQNTHGSSSSFSSTSVFSTSSTTNESSSD